MSGAGPHRALVGLALATVLAGAGAPALAVTPPSGRSIVAPQAASCAGVWVVVDYGSLGGGVSTRCATSHGTGLAALRSAGFAPTVEEGFVLKLSGKPGKPDINKAYWSYWQASKQDDGSYGGWKYSNLGAGSYRPAAGDAEGWHYVSLSAGNSPPGEKPPVNVPPPTPKPSATKKPTPKPSATKPGRTTSTKRPTTATTSASRSPSPTNPGTPTSAPTSGAPSSTASPPTAATPSGTPYGTPEAGSAPEPNRTEAPQDAGSPVGAIVAGALVVLSAAGLGLWWLLKGRRS